MSALTSDTIITRVLKMGGNETITTEAQYWLLDILDRLYEDFHWPFLEKVATGSVASGATSIALPADFDSFWDENSLVLVTSSGGQYPLALVTGYDQDWVTSPGITGAPETALVNLNARTWRPYPLPEQTYTYQLRYKHKPTRADPYANFTPTFPNDAILIQALFVRVLQFEDDDRYAPESQVLASMVSQYKAKFNKQPQRAKKVRFSSRFKTPSSFR